MNPDTGTPLLPSFIIVGAMKSGTTTLYRDLSYHPQVFFPNDKEPEVLTKFRDVEDARHAYRSLFRKARAGQVLGEASTAYTKRPTYENVASHALAVCGPLKIVYLHRDPIERMVSHYKHFVSHGLMHGPFEDVVERDSTLIDYSRYDWQIQPWIDVFGEQAVLRIALEEYARERQAVVERVVRHIGLSAEDLPELDPARIANRAAETKRIHNPLMDLLHRSFLYRDILRPLMSADMRERLRRLVLPDAKVPEIELPPRTLAYIEDQLSRSPAAK
jgi:hypothetical protein